MPSVVLREALKAFQVDRIYVAIVPIGAGKFKFVLEGYDEDGLLEGREVVEAKAAEVRREWRSKLDRTGSLGEDKSTSGTTDPESGATTKL